MTENLPVPGVIEKHDPTVLEYTITWGELRQAWERVFIDKTHKLKLNQNHHTIQQFLRSSDRPDSWRGFSVNEAHTWLKEGYKPGLQQISLDVPFQRERRRVHSAEEGEYQHDAALSGFDYPFLSWDKRLGKRGVRVLYNVAMNCGTPAGAVNKYLSFVAEFSHSLEYADLDFSLGFVCEVTGLGLSKNRARINILVKNEDEASAFQSWSSMLSPAAFRGYTFFAMILAAEHEGRHCSENLGYPVGVANFTVEVEHDTETIVINKPVSFTEKSVDKDWLRDRATTLLENPFDKEAM